MTMWAALAAKQLALASGLESNVVPTLGARAIDGFAIGALMTAACFLAVTAPRRARRFWRPRMPGSRAGFFAWRRRDACGDRMMAAQSAAVGQNWPDLPRGADDRSAAGQPGIGSDPDGGSDRSAGGTGEGDLPGGYRSRHRRTDGPGVWRPEPRRSMPRHAAPPPGFGSMMASLLAAGLPAGAMRH
jgi:hypothetical protein